jgi:hypothetical protein
MILVAALNEARFRSLIVPGEKPAVLICLHDFLRKFAQS